MTALSQGTLDLVYLAARLGLVRLVTGDRRPPLVFDDPFVTLDDVRAERALSLLKRVAPDFQIIYLTTSDRYDAAADAVVELPGPDGRGRRRRPTPRPSAAARARPDRGSLGRQPDDRVRARGGRRRGVPGTSAAAWSVGASSVFGVVLVTQLVGMAIAAGIAAIRGEPFPLGMDLVLCVLAGVMGVIGITSLYRGLAVGRMGVVAPVTGVLAAVIPVVAGIVLEGWPATLVLVGIGLAVVAVVLVSRVAGRPGDRTERPPRGTARRRRHRPVRGRHLRDRRRASCSRR